jgi:hypoxanthine phosphoribosyltransferase
MKKIYYTWSDVESQTQEILRQIALSDWRPDYVVGLTRGGLAPANLVSQYLEVPMECLKVSLRDDGGEPEHNLWMAEDAYNGKNILVVDDINDSGATLDWIKADWEDFHPSKREPWATIWNNTVRFAVLVNNEASKYKRIDYSCIDINKVEEPSWIVFPWEDWWKSRP